MKFNKETSKFKILKILKILKIPLEQIAFFLILISILISIPLTTYSKSSVDDHLAEISQISAHLSRNYNFAFNVNDGQTPLMQNMYINNCEVNLETYSENGLLWRDNYDLSTLNPHSKVLKYKGTYHIAFGVIPQLMRRSDLYFDTKEERDDAISQLRDLANLCHKLKVKKAIKEIKRIEQEIAENLEGEFIGGIPYESGANAGVIRDDENEKLALLRGEMSFYERYTTLINAKKSIYAQYLIFRGDESGKFTTDLLIKKKEQGVDVKVIVDGFSLFDKGQGKNVQKNSLKMLNNLMASGIRVFGYSCAGKLVRNELQGLDAGKLIRRNHEKMWIVDGELAGRSTTSMAIVGGINISQEYFRLTGPGKDNWRDQDIAMKGEIVGDFYNAFLRNFKIKGIMYKTYMFDDWCFNPYNPQTEREKYLAFKEDKSEEYLELSGEESKTAEKVKFNMQKFLDGYVGIADVEGNARMIKSSPNYMSVDRVRALLSRPDEKEDYIFSAYIDLINKAKDEILIANAYFIPQPEMRKALINASLRGVKVRILSNSPETNDLPMMTIVGRYRYLELVEPAYGKRNSASASYIYTRPKTPEELKIYEWVGMYIGKSDGGESIGDAELDLIMKDRKRTDGTMHSKFMVVDRRVGIVGAYNLDSSSRKNTESAVIFEGENLARELAHYFEIDLLKSRFLTLNKIKEYRNPKPGKYRMTMKFGLLIENML
ncbi:MAG: phosphatidylserine/phosphatidylglycerophosphate/cardiolipin synthase family protein [Oligoflexia bacterium]|nr:phosphatidylserine/phosphatidylglycerophosphate/cardiolipin synthase family protein [Oligoflexia bacterium]